MPQDNSSSKYPPNFCRFYRGELGAWKVSVPDKSVPGAFRSADVWIDSVPAPRGMGDPIPLFVRNHEPGLDGRRLLNSFIAFRQEKQMLELEEWRRRNPADSDIDIPLAVFVVDESYCRF